MSFKNNPRIIFSEKYIQRKMIHKKNITIKQGVNIILFFCLITVMVFGTPSEKPSQADSSDQTIFFPAVYKSGDFYSWPTVGANPQRTSWSASEVRGTLKPEWYKKFDGYISQKVQIIAADSKLFISTSDGLYALDAATGIELWFYPTDLPLGHSPTYDQGSVFVGGFDGKIHAINARTGQKQWEFSASAGFDTNPLVVNGIVYAGSRDGFFYAIYARGVNAGTQAWKYKTDGPIIYSAAFANNTIYFASSDMYAYALRASDGALIWKSSSKLPGNKLRSWWPVIYRDYVVFSGAYNYRLVPPYGGYNHKTMALEGAYPSGLSDGEYMAPLGTVSGDWAPGTRTINASTVSQYFELYPYRRTTMLFSLSTGQEYTYDSDRDGKPEYAPIQFFGTRSGTRYPPAIGPDNVLYHSNHYIYGDYIPRGQISGWKFGTSTISIPASFSNAADEPLGYAIGGSVVYYKLCCDRTAGAFSLTDPYNTYYFGYSGELRRTFPELYSSGWNFAYWKHGDTSPPIPYNGKVYTINNNAVIAFSTLGKDMVLYNEYLGKDTGEPVSNIERSTTITGLNTKVTINPTSWPLLFQQERYFEIRNDSSTRARHFRLFEVAGSSSSGTSSLSTSSNSLTTTLTSMFGSNRLVTRISRRSPTVLLNSDSSIYRLVGNFAGIAYDDNGVKVQTTAGTISGSGLDSDWLMVWDNTTNHRWAPVVLSLQNRPSSITFSSTGIQINFASPPAGYMGVTPLNGMSDPLTNEVSTWPGGISSGTITRVQMINRMARYFPTSSGYSLSIDENTGDATQTFTYSDIISYSGFQTSAPSSLGFIPPQIALAAWNSSPIRINGMPLESHTIPVYLTPIGQIAWVENTSTVTVRYPGLANYWKDELPAPPQALPDDPIRSKLEEEIQKIVDAGHLLPGYGMHGIWDGGGSWLGTYLADYWENPAETYFTLIRALPFLSSSLQSEVRAYITSEFQDFPSYTYCHTGWNSGVSRQAFALPPEVIADSVNFPPNTCPSTVGHGFPQENLYASWLYANEFPANALSVYNNSKPKLITNYSFRTSLPYLLNSHIAGYFGYLKMAQLASPAEDQSDKENILINLLTLRTALSKYPAALEQTGFEYASLQWSVRSYAPNSPDTLFSVRNLGTLWSQMPLYGFPIDIKYGMSGGPTGGGYGFGIDFVNLVPELGNFMHDYVLAETQIAVDDYNRRAPYWFVSEAEEGAGEGVVVPLYDVVALFSAKALILKQDPSQLEPYLDVASVPVGDLYYIQRLILALSAE